MTFPAAQTHYLASLQIRHRSPNTLRIYREDLSTFAAYLQTLPLTDLREVTPDTIAHYQHWLLTSRPGRPYSQATYLMKLRALRALFTHLHTENLLLLNPAAGLRLRQARQLPRRILSIRQARRILDKPNLTTHKGLRDRAILELFYSTGLRLCEMAALTIRHIDLSTHLLRVEQGKGRKDRILPLGQTAANALKRYCQEVRRGWADPEQLALWLSAHPPHPPLSKQSLQLLCKHHAAQARLHSPPHTWRHSCATHLLRSGAHLLHIQQLLGHRNLTTTQRYCQVALADLQHTFDRAHPRQRQARRREASPLDHPPETQSPKPKA
jgi:integrase/recombinase XerD